MSISEHDKYFCGKCRKTQDDTEGEACLVCGLPTVVWKKFESKEQAFKRWDNTNGKSKRKSLW